MDGTIVVAAIAVVASTTTAVYSLRAQTERERQRWLREQQTAAYLDLMTYLATIRQFLTSPATNPKPYPDPDLSARMNAFGSRRLIPLVTDLRRRVARLKLAEEGEVPDDERLSETEWTAGETRIISDLERIIDEIRRELGVDAGLPTRLRWWRRRGSVSPKDPGIEPGDRQPPSVG